MCKVVDKAMKGIGLVYWITVSIVMGLLIGCGGEDQSGQDFQLSGLWACPGSGASDLSLYPDGAYETPAQTGQFSTSSISVIFTPAVALCGDIVGQADYQLTPMEGPEVGVRRTLTLGVTVAPGQVQTFGLTNL